MHQKTMKNSLFGTLKICIIPIMIKALIRDLNDIKKNTQKFEKKYLNKVNALSAENLHKAIKQLEGIDIVDG